MKNMLSMTMDYSWLDQWWDFGEIAISQGSGSIFWTMQETNIWTLYDNALAVMSRKDNEKTSVNYLFRVIQQYGKKSLSPSCISAMDKLFWEFQQVKDLHRSLSQLLELSFSLLKRGSVVDTHYMLLCVFSLCSRGEHMKKGIENPSQPFRHRHISCKEQSKKEFLLRKCLKFPVGHFPDSR